MRARLLLTNLGGDSMRTRSPGLNPVVTGKRRRARALWVYRKALADVLAMFGDPVARAVRA